MKKETFEFQVRAPVEGARRRVRVPFRHHVIQSVNYSHDASTDTQDASQVFQQCEQRNSRFGLRSKNAHPTIISIFQSPKRLP